jgi:hypothetical protein
LVLALLISLACNAPLGRATAFPESTTEPASVPSSEPAVAAVALRLDGGLPQLAAFVGPITAAWSLPEGDYQIGAVNQDGQILLLSETQITDESLNWQANFQSADSAEAAEQAAAIRTIATFLVQAEDAKLTALENSSGGFSAPLFSTDPGQAELDELYERYAAIAGQETAVMDALEVVFGSGLSEGRSPKVAAPARGLKDSLLGFFGYAGAAGERARDRILKISNGLSPEEKADAFNAVREGFRGNADNFDEFLANLLSGDLDTQAAQIESDMRNAPGFGAAAQAAGAAVGQVVHEEGAQLVTKGAELQAQVIRGVLGNVFPDITRGFDLADKANNWANYIETIYKDPLAAAEGEARDALQDKIKQRILSDLQQCCPGMGEDLVDQLADKVSQEAVNAIPDLASNVTATELPAWPVIELRFDLVETVTGDVASKATSASIVLTADYRTGAIAGSLEGTINYDAGRLCVNPSNPSETWDYMPVAYVATFVADVSGSLDVSSGEFSISIAPAGEIVDRTVTQPFTDSRCTQYNSDPPPEIGPFGNLGSFTGTGTIAGNVSPTGEARVTTDWHAANAQVKGSWFGQGEIGP